MTGNVHPIQVKVAYLSIGMVLLIGLLGLAGIAFNIPRLYNWDLRGTALNIQIVCSLILLATGYLLHLIPVIASKRFTGFLSLLGFAAVFCIAAWEMNAYFFADKTIPADEFLSPDEPLAGHISFYTALGLLIASIGSFVTVVPLKRHPWLLGAAQILGILLINLTAFGFAENLRPDPVFRFFTSIPSSIGLFFYALALLFFPAYKLHLVSPFFSTTQNRLYTSLLCIGWILTVLWQATWAVPYWENSVNMAASTVNSLVIADEIFEVLLTSFVLGLGLHILGTLDKNVKLNQEIQASSEKLQEAFGSYATLAATLSHDLKAPIQTQISALEMIQSGHFGQTIAEARNQKMLHSLLESNRFELELVLNLVDLLRYEIREEQFNPQPLEINALLQDVKRDLEPLALRKGHEIQIHPCPENSQTLIADSFGLKRVLHNLVNNAIQHLGSGGHIEIAVTPRLQENDFLFSVRDNGPGIPAEIQQQLFKRFSKWASKGSPLSSSGLGLYITKQIVDRHNGKIWVESEPGQGTAFYYTIPQQPVLAEA